MKSPIFIFFSLSVQKYRVRANVVTLTWCWRGCHFNVLSQSFLCDGQGTVREALLHKNWARGYIFFHAELN